jgi:hypothetical protein
MHTKALGNIGEAAVAKWLLERGYKVFTELGDLSKIDLIAEKKGKLLKIQVKAIKSRKGIVKLYRRKNGPNYQFVYAEQDVDWFAVYVYNKNLILWVPSSELCTYMSAMNIRLEPPRNGTKTGFHMYTDYVLEDL